DHVAVSHRDPHARVLAPLEVEGRFALGQARQPDDVIPVSEPGLDVVPHAVLRPRFGSSTSIGTSRPRTLFDNSRSHSQTFRSARKMSKTPSDSSAGTTFPPSGRAW